MSFEMRSKSHQMLEFRTKHKVLQELWASGKLYGENEHVTNVVEAFSQTVVDGGKLEKIDGCWAKSLLDTFEDCREGGRFIDRWVE